MRHCFIIAIILLICSFTGQAQPQLKVVGTSSTSVAPTQTTLSFEVFSKKMSYESAIRDMSNRVESLNTTLRALKFKPEEIFTTNFQIDKYRDWNRVNQKDSGYYATQTVKVTFKLDKERLIDILNEVTSSNSDPFIQIRFDVDKETSARVKSTLMEAAMLDAKAKADILLKSTDYQIEGIHSIEYGGIYSPDASIYASDAVYEVVPTFTPENLTKKETVNVIYLLGAK